MRGAPRSLLWVFVALISAIVLIVANQYRHTINETGGTYELAGIKYSLDFDQGLARARRLNKPVLVYFRGMSSVNDGRMEIGPLKSPRIIERLRKFECILALVRDISGATDLKDVPLAQKTLQLERELLGEVAFPAFVVIANNHIIGDVRIRKKPLATSIGLTIDEVEFGEFLDKAYEEWKKNQPRR